jgi:hypothetical protein
MAAWSSWAQRYDTDCVSQGKQDIGKRVTNASPLRPGRGVMPVPKRRINVANTMA